MIGSSENLLLRIVRLLAGGCGFYPNLEEIEGLRSAEPSLSRRSRSQRARRQIPHIVARRVVCQQVADSGSSHADGLNNP